MGGLEQKQGQERRTCSARIRDLRPRAEIQIKPYFHSSTRAWTSTIHRCIFCVSSFSPDANHRWPPCISSKYHFYSIEKETKEKPILQQRENRLITVERSSHEKKARYIYIYMYIDGEILMYIKRLRSQWPASRCSLRKRAKWRALWRSVSILVRYRSQMNCSVDSTSLTATDGLWVYTAAAGIVVLV